MTGCCLKMEAICKGYQIETSLLTTVTKSIHTQSELKAPMNTRVDNKNRCMIIKGLNCIFKKCCFLASDDWN